MSKEKQRVGIEEFSESTGFQIVDQPVDDIDMIRQTSMSNDMDDEAFYICNISNIIQKHRLWKKCMPRVIPFYAVKCNDSPIVLQTLATLGTGFDCASKGEIAMVMNCGVAPQSIIYANPTKSVSHLKYARERGVSVMTVDNDYELHKIKQHYPDAKLVLRIRCDAKFTRWLPFGKKFGCDPDKEAEGLIKLAKSLDLNMIGISFHVGCGCMESSAYERAIQLSRKLFDFAASIDYNFTLLDIGGGFPGEIGTDIEEIASIVNRSIEMYFPSPNVDIIAEPGRYYVSSAFTLACRIHSMRKVYRNGKFDSFMYHINDGVFGSFINCLFDKSFAHPTTLKSENEELFKSIIWGQTAASIDQVCEDVLLPKLDIDDFIIFQNMGAYTIPVATSFNGFPRSKVKFYIDRKHLNVINKICTIKVGI